VVGARCAGAPLAALLARAGLRVGLVDRARFPSDSPSTHAIQPGGVEVLERLGARAEVERVAATVDGGVLVLDDIRVEFDRITERFGAPMLNARRVALDAILLEVAARAGADVRTGTPVTGLVERDGRVAGVRTAAGALHAPLVVGADGARSTVARLVGAEEYHRTPGRRVFVWGYFSGVGDERRIWLGRRGDYAYLASPTDGDRFMVAVVPSADRWPELRGDREGSYADGLAAGPSSPRGWRAARARARCTSCPAGTGSSGAPRARAGRSSATRATSRTRLRARGSPTRCARAPRWPTRSGATSGRPTLDAALRDWWLWRDRDAWQMYLFADQMGAPGPTPPLLQALQRALAQRGIFVDPLLEVLNHERAAAELVEPRVAAAVTLRELVAGRTPRRALAREAGDLLASTVRSRRGPYRRGIPSPDRAATASARARRHPRTAPS
jgi:2-polyprenyl-6-methoxyphenol hydroxylase-like FAD-dependent oxidoreductase